MDKVDECGTGGSVLPLSLPMPEPFMPLMGPWLHRQFTGAEENHQLEVFLKI